MDRDTKVIFIILAIILALGVFFVGKVVTKSKDEEKIENIENIENNKNNVVESVTSKAKHMELVTFNSQFTAFEGKEKKSISELRTLESMINSSNMTNSTHQIEMILPNGYTEIDDLDKGKKYSIILEYDEQGYVNKVNVTMNETINDFNVTMNETINDFNVTMNETINDSNVTMNETINDSNVTMNETINDSTVLRIIGIFGYILYAVGMWKLFNNEGMPGWFAVIPILNQVMLLRMVGLSGWYILLLLIPYAGILAALVLNIVVANRLARMYGKSIGYVLGLLFLPFIFYPLLGFRGA